MPSVGRAKYEWTKYTAGPSGMPANSGQLPPEPQSRSSPCAALSAPGRAEAHHFAGQQAEPGAPSRASQRGLDWFIFFLADVQTGFGPFIAVYLTTQKWTQVEIGFVLSIGGIIGLLGQMPGGAIVDTARSERMVASLAVATIGMCALSYAVWPIFPVVAAAATLHALASCVLGPAIAAISLGLVGPLAIGERLGRNARFASLGNGSAAALMGACGYFCRAAQCSWLRSSWRFRPCWRSRASASARSTSRRPMARCERGADTKATSVFSSCASVRC